MSANEDFAEGKFKIECSEIVLTRAGGDPVVVRGPGEIWQDDEDVLRYKIFADQPGYHALQAYMSRPRVVGQIIPDEDYFTLQAQEYSLPTWTADRVLPSCRGGPAHGLAYGYLHELVRTDTYPKAAPSGFIRLLFRSKLEFPCNQGTETVIRVGGTEHHTSTTLNAAFVEDGAFRFDILHEHEHTAATLELPSDQLTPVTSNRIREALQFVLGQQLALMVVETTVGGQRVTRLTSPSRGHGKMPPPLRFHLVDEGGHVWRMFTNYFRHVHANAKPGPHTISQHVGSAIQSTAATLEAQVLALAVAVEGLAADCFASLAPVSGEFLRELEAVATAIEGVALSARTRARIKGMLVRCAGRGTRTSFARSSPTIGSNPVFTTLGADFASPLPTEAA